MRRITVLRPEPGASETVARARTIGLDAVAIPLFEVEPVAWVPPDPTAIDGLLLTSANAVRHGGAGLRRLGDLPVYAVGETTAAVARESGFYVAAVGGGGVDALLDAIDPDVRLLHLCGEDRVDSESAAQRLLPLVAYRARPVESPDLSSIRGTVALVHSPRAARRLAELIDDRGQVRIAAISPAAARAAGEGWAEVEAAGEPTDAALLALAARLCEKPQP